MGRTIEEVAGAHASAWMSIPGVVGVYSGEDEMRGRAITVMIAVPVEELGGAIPSDVEGFPVVFVDASDLRPMKAPGRPGT